MRRLKACLLYTSHVRASKANKIYIANVMTQPGETTGYTLNDHVEALIAHGGEGIIDTVPVSYTHLDVYKRQVIRYIV